MVAAGTTTHHLTLYRAPSGALVFSAGSIQWAWGLDQEHDGDGAAADPRMQQATVNLLADMKAQPGTLMTGLVAATASTDTTGPRGHHQLARVRCGDRQRHDGHGQRRGDRRRRARGGRRGLHRRRCVLAPGDGHDRVELHLRAVRARVDAGARPRGRRQRQHRRDRHPVVHRGVPVLDLRLDGPEDPRRERPWRGRAGPEVLRRPATGSSPGVRFYKGSGNTGTHVGSLWSSTGARLATATFQNESAAGWQTATLSPAVAGHGRDDVRRVVHRSRRALRRCRTTRSGTAGVSAPPLQVAGGFGASGPGTFGAPGTFPAESFRSTQLLRRRRLLVRRHHAPDHRRPVADRRLHQRARRLTGQRACCPRRSPPARSR